MKVRLWWLIICVALLWFILPAAAQESHYQVFLTRSLTGDQLIFIDLISGDEHFVDVQGSQYTMTDQGVLYLGNDGRVMLAAAQDRPRPHPFIAQPEDADRIDWVVSPNGSSVAWTITRRSDGGLTTETWLARADGDGSDQRIVLADGARAGIRAYPVTFSPDNTTLYMDFQPDTIASLTPFRQYAALFALDLASGEIASLPGEAGCYCGAAVRDDQFLRMVLAANGFDLRAYALTDSASAGITISGLGNADYTQGGDLLISPDGEHAVYALARPVFGDNAGLETLFVLVDSVRRTQEALTEPVTERLRPLAWLNDGAVLLMDAAIEGTWRLDTATGAITQIASATYLGTIPIAFTTTD
jgi:hypothetical protein